MLRDVGVELVGLFNLVPRCFDKVRELLSLRLDTLGLVLFWLWKPTAGRLPRANGNGLVADELHDSHHSVII